MLTAQHFPTTRPSHSSKQAKELEFESACKTIIAEIGENPSRSGLVDTPKRFRQALEELTEGYRQNVEQIVNGALYDSESSQLVLVKDIEFYSLCEHHLLPFFGKAHIAYIPDRKIIGLSKIPRIVEMFSKRLQVQERLTKEIAQQLNQTIKPKGLVCFLEATHMCMAMRGVRSQQSKMHTQFSIGCLEQNEEQRERIYKRCFNQPPDSANKR